MGASGEPKQEPDSGVAARHDSAWLPAAAEAEAYEGIRRGDEAAFRAVAQPLQPVLRRLAGLAVGSSVEVDRIVARTWSGALRGLDMFQWHTPFATWVAKNTVAQGRGAAAASSRPHGPPGPAPTGRRTPTASGPADWSDLPWSARWEQALETLTAALAALPLPLREVVFANDVDRWPPRRVCEVLGLPEEVYARLLAQGRAHLRDALAALVGEPAASTHRGAQVERAAEVAGLVAWPLDDRSQDGLDPATVMVFRRWWATQVPVWRRVPTRLLRPRGESTLVSVPHARH